MEKHNGVAHFNSKTRRLLNYTREGMDRDNLIKSVEFEGQKVDCVSKGSTSLTIGDIFRPIDSNITIFEFKENHPISPKGLNKDEPIIQTNKFYANLFLTDQHQPVYTIPYSIAWTGCNQRRLCHKGIVISHIDEDQLHFGPGSPAEYFYAPSGQHSLVLSAVEVGTEPNLTTKNATPWSITLELSSQSGQSYLEMPLVQGMGFVTAKYSGATPMIGSLIGIQKLSIVGRRQADAIAKYNIDLVDGTRYVMFATTSKLCNLPRFIKQSENMYVSDKENFTGTIQIAKLPKDLETNVYDVSAGHYAVGASLQGSVTGNSGTYTISWQRGGLANRILLMFLLPHQVESIAADDKDKLLALQLRTPTKGTATAIMGNSVTFVEPQLPSDLGFHPWLPNKHEQATRLQSIDRINFIRSIAKEEIDRNISLRLNGEQSIYWGGKVYISLFDAVDIANVYRSSLHMPDWFMDQLSFTIVHLQSAA
jgi:endo-1,3(4)-beta-glucanase